MNELLAMKKTLTNIDANCLQDLIRAITDEFSCVLKISKEEVNKWIIKLQSMKTLWYNTESVYYRRI